MYRLNASTLAVGTRRGRPVVFLIPTGAIITTEEKTPEVTPLSDVHWEGQAVTISSVDLRKCGTRIQ